MGYKPLVFHRLGFYFVILFFNSAFSPVSASEAIHFLIAEGASEPYQIVSTISGSAHSGVLTEVLQLALRDSGVQMTSVVRPYKRIKVDILARAHPNWVSYGSPAWLDERVLQMGEYSRLPILQSPYVLASLRNDLVPDLGDLRVKKVIVILGYTYFPSFQHWVSARNIELVYAPSHRHALSMLRHGRGDFYLAEEIRVRWQIRDAGMKADDFHLLDFSAILPESVLYFLFDKRMPARIKADISHRLKHMRDQGAIAEIVNRYQ